MDKKAIQTAFEIAKERYAALGVDVESAMQACAQLPISMHCWQGDDVTGFELRGGASGGIAATGNYPGRARTAQELRDDMAFAISLIPGAKNVNLHAIYADEPAADRSKLTPAHFTGWIEWAKQHNVGLDYNPTFFAHPMAESGFTLSSADPAVRAFWVEHGKSSRVIGEAFGKALGKRCVINFWMPDGYKDLPLDTYAPRARMAESLDEIFQLPIDSQYSVDAVESKLFGLGVESYTVGSHEFCMGYALSRNKLLCLDAGHFHPTEVISAKISALMLYLPELLLHVSRPVRWDSDHVVLFDDELKQMFQEIVRGGFTKRVNVALDFFDASINRIAAWAIGTRNAQKGLLYALLEPTELIRKAEQAGDYTSRLALIEDAKTLPFAAVWDQYCLTQNVPTGSAWLDAVKQYERETLSKRD